MPQPAAAWPATVFEEVTYGIRAVVDVEQGALRAFEQDAVAAGAGVVEMLPDGRQEGDDLGGDLLQFGDEFVRVDFAGARGLYGARCGARGGSRLWLSVSRDRRGRSRAARGGRLCLRKRGRCRAWWCRSSCRNSTSRGCVSSSPWSGRISGAFSATSRFVLSIVRPWRLHALDLGDQRPWIDDDAVADDRAFVRARDAGRQQREFVRLAVDDERVARVVAALEAHHDIGALATASRRSCLCLRRPTGRRSPQRLPSEHQGFCLFHDRDFAQFGENAFGHGVVDFDERDGVAAGGGAAEVEACDVDLRVAEQRAELADEARFVFVRDVEHVRREVRFHVDALHLDEARHAVREDGAGDVAGLAFGHDFDHHIAFVGAVLGAAHFGDLDAALLRHDRGVDHVDVGERRFEQARERRLRERAGVQIGGVAFEDEFDAT